MTEQIKGRVTFGECLLQFNSKSHHLLSKDVKIKMNKTIVLLPVVHGCETWSLRLKKERGGGMFENKKQKKVF
jgi:hypothetical protein